MSGLALVYHRNGRAADRAEICAMLQAVPYRGPDGMQAQLFGAAALGYARMIVTPEEVDEVQPVVSPRTGCAIVADVRLDNRGDLLRSLPSSPRSESTDAELILLAYEAWGTEAPARLLGDFAFLIWDPRDRRVVAARDVSGQCPLFYRSDGDSFAAASEIHQLLQDPDAAPLANPHAVFEQLVPLHVYASPRERAETFYQGIHALLPGHALVADRNGVVVRKYWEFHPPEIRYRTDGDYAAHFRELFFEAVRARLRSARPTAALLSGGLDSSSIVCTAQELYRSGAASDRGFFTLSVLFGDLECDETRLIRDVETKYGVDARYIPNEQISFGAPREPVGFEESPQIGGAPAGISLCAAAIAGGARVILTGDIADACVGGTRQVFDSLLRQGKLSELWKQLRAYCPMSPKPLLRTLLLECAAPLLPLPIQSWLAAGAVRRATTGSLHRLLPGWMPEPLRRQLAERHLELAVKQEQERRFSNPARETEYRRLFPQSLQRSPAGWPLQFSRPYGDRRLHDFLFGIPPEQKFQPDPRTDEFYAGSKRIVRQGLVGVLPESIRTRMSKTVFTSAISADFARQWPQVERSFGPGSRSLVADSGYIEPGPFWARLQAIRDGAPAPDLIYVLLAIALETWLRSLQLPWPRSVTVDSRVAEVTVGVREEVTPYLVTP